jgi:NADH-quinone oxidoreductase subunit J
MPLYLFIFLGVLTVITALGVIAQRNPVHCLMALVLNLLTIAVIFMGLGAVTLGFLQAIIYAGAIMVLFLFVIWLLNIQAAEQEMASLVLKLLGSLVAAALVAEFFVFIVRMPAKGGEQAPPPDYGSISRLAQAMFSTYLVSFEITSVLLLAAIVGAVALARRVPRRNQARESAPRQGAAQVSR